MVLKAAVPVGADSRLPEMGNWIEFRSEMLIAKAVRLRDEDPAMP